jgi:hypothetical protein
LELRTLALFATFTRFLADLIIGMDFYYIDKHPFCKGLRRREF